MKIVYCHNYYRNRGGEDVSFECDLELLRSHGHEVVAFTKDNHDLSSRSPSSIARTIWNRQTEREMTDVLRAQKPDVLHCNNLFPMISPSVYRAASRLNIPVVQALRNYRNLCANSFLFRDGEVCRKCLTSSASWSGIRHRCYRNSAAATAVVVAGQFANRVFRIQRRYVNAFFTPTEFAKQVHVDAGYPAANIFRRNNYILPDLDAVETKQDYALFVGRLSPEKGVSTITEAWSEHGINTPLRIIGDGPERASIEQQTSDLDHVTCLGELPTEEVLRQIATAKFLIISSRWYETFGRTIAESFSRGTPVIASDLGAMAELVQDGKNGFLFAPGSAAGLADAVNRLETMTPARRAEMQRDARQSYENECSPENSYRELMRIYESVIDCSDAKRELIAQLKLEQVKPQQTPTEQLAI